MKQKLLRLRPPRIALALLTIAMLLYLLIPDLRTGWWSHPVLGLLTFALGFSIMMWAWALFQRLQNPICPTAEAVTLVRTGPYGLSRNPMYLGMLLMLLAVFVGLGSPVFLAPPLLFLAILRFVFVPFEEKQLLQIFSDEFTHYQRETRRWL